MKKNKRSPSIFNLAATYIGTVVGAGFASGQEVLQFFGFFGTKGPIAIVLATVLFALYGYMILELGQNLKAKSHLKVIKYSAGPRLSVVLDGITSFFLFGAFSAMAAGAGAIFIEQFGAPGSLGAGVMVTSAILTVLFGIYGVINAISLVVPLLLIVLLVIAAYTLSRVPMADLILHMAESATLSRPPVPFWPLSSFVYVSYNIIMAVAILAPMGALVKKNTLLKTGALLGSIGLGLGALLIYLCVTATLPESSNFQVPMVYVASRVSPVAGNLYSITLLSEVYTTAVSNLYGFSARISGGEKRIFKPVVIVSGIGAFIASSVGFARLVRVLYPAVGYAGLVLLISLSLQRIKRLLIIKPK